MPYQEPYSSVNDESYGKDQLQRTSALNILINAICVWNTKYLEKAIDYKNLKEEE
jgi:TnpA family transposase